MAGATTRDDRASESRGRVPPHNIEAEESVLGALLLSRDAIGVGQRDGRSTRPTSTSRPTATSSTPSGRCTRRARPADTVTVADELRRAGLLAEVGGAETLHELQNATPAISSAGHYAKIVQDTALLRQLIHVAGDIAEIAYSEPDDVIKAARRGRDARSSRSPSSVSPTRTRTIEELLQG